MLVQLDRWDRIVVEGGDACVSIGQAPVFVADTGFSAAAARRLAGLLIEAADMLDRA